MPCIDDGIAVECLIDIQEEIVSEREQVAQCLEGRMHGHYRESESGNGE